jgi:hypothetical protein
MVNYYAIRSTSKFRTAKASLLGAKTVNGPVLERVSTRLPAALTAWSHVLSSTTEEDNSMRFGATSTSVHSASAQHRKAAPEEKRWALVCVFPIFVSRACLGKMFVLMYKWLKKTVFTHRALGR